MDFIKITDKYINVKYNDNKFWFELTDNINESSNYLVKNKVFNYGLYNSETKIIQLFDNNTYNKFNDKLVDFLFINFIDYEKMI